MARSNKTSTDELDSVVTVDDGTPENDTEGGVPFTVETVELDTATALRGRRSVYVDMLSADVRSYVTSAIDTAAQYGEETGWSERDRAIRFNNIPPKVVGQSRSQSGEPRNVDMLAAVASLVRSHAKSLGLVPTVSESRSDPKAHMLTVTLAPKEKKTKTKDAPEPEAPEGTVSEQGEAVSDGTA